MGDNAEQKIKCVIWDLDNTLWDGIISEDSAVTLKEDVAQVIRELDERGILHSISSKNNLEDAKAMLEKFGLWDYFIYPEINWNPKSESVERIAANINIGRDSLAFIDDQAFERDEVNHFWPEVLCLDAALARELPGMERFTPKFITADAKNRRKMYQADIRRNATEEDFSGTKEEFLETLNMVFTIGRAQESDLQRAEDLTVRTHQLNSTGYIYSYEELKAFIKSDDHEVLIAGLEDKYGDYGKIGLALIEKGAEVWELKLILMSCRVMSKGVGNVFINYIINKARAAGVSLRARFVPTDRNRLMYVTYKFNGFNEESTEGDLVMFGADMSRDRAQPDFVKLVDDIN